MLSFCLRLMSKKGIYDFDVRVLAVALAAAVEEEAEEPMDV